MPLAEIPGILGVETVHERRRWYHIIKRAPSPGEGLQLPILLLGRDLRKALETASRGGELTAVDRFELDQWLQGKKRIRRRQGVVYIGIFIVAFAFGTLVRSRLFSAGPIDVIWIPLMVSVAVLLAAFFKDWMLEKSVDTALVEIKIGADKTTEEVSRILNKNLRPRIVPLDSPVKVLRTATDIIAEAIKEPLEHRFVIFIGAASLVTRSDVRQEGDEEHKSPVTDYRNILISLNVEQIKVVRYVALLTKEDFLLRKPETREKYLKWLEQQIERLRGNSNYSLIDCPRAQSWGGSRSSIVTHKSFLDIVGEGDSGFLIQDEEVARTLYETSERLFKVANKRASYSGGENIELLENKRSELENLNREREG